MAVFPQCLRVLVDGASAFLVGANPHGVLDRDDEDLPGADLAGPTRPFDGVDHVLDQLFGYHDLQLHDIDNDGRPELITGKRYRAHVGRDPGANDPIGLYYFEINKGNFDRVTIDYGDPKSASGAGIHFCVQDIDGNGWKDIVAPGKEGLYLFTNKGR